MSDPGLVWLAAAFAVTWILIGLYLVRLWAAQRAIETRLNELAREPAARAASPPDAELQPHSEPGDFATPDTDLP